MAQRERIIDAAALYQAHPLNDAALAAWNAECIVDPAVEAAFVEAKASVIDRHVFFAELTATYEEHGKMIGNVDATDGDTAALNSLLATLKGMPEGLVALENEKAAESRSTNRQPRATVNARMLDIMLRNPEARGWTARQWAKEQKCGKSTVTDTPTWKELELTREKLTLVNRQDRRQKGKGS